MDALSVGTEADGTLGIALRGELDYTNSVQVGEAIRSAMADARPVAVRVDIAEVTFLDSSGIGVLVTAMRCAEDVRAAFRVARPSPNVFDQLRMTGLLEAFGMAPAASEG
jgi:anti-sigma B factor antagonist